MIRTINLQLAQLGTGFKGKQFRQCTNPYYNKNYNNKVFYVHKRDPAMKPAIGNCHLGLSLFDSQGEALWSRSI